MHDSTYLSIATYMYKCLKYCSFIPTVQLLAGKLSAIGEAMYRTHSLFVGLIV